MDPAAPGRFHTLQEAFKSSSHCILTSCSRELVRRSFPSFTDAERERLYRMLIRVASALDKIDEFEEEQNLDVLASEKTSIEEVEEKVSRAKKDEIEHLKGLLKKAEESNNALKARVELLKKGEDSTASRDLLNKRLLVPSWQPNGSHLLPPAPHHHQLPPSSQLHAMAATLSSVAAPSLTNRSSIVRAQLQAPPSVISASTKTGFHGVSLVDTRWAAGHRRSSGRRRLLQVNARSTAAKNIEVEVDKPLGLALGQKPGGGVVITSVESGGNAAKAGLKAGDQVLYTSSFFGDELWPADKLGFTKTAIQAKSDSVYFVERATHICLDCGYIYFLPKPFEEQPDDYGCPQCNAAKKRFARYDVATGKPIGGTLPPITVINLS
nr:unnamed protein product [Digitaria exilis]